MTQQPNLFETSTVALDVERMLLYALGEFQSRGKVLAERELALDRLRGAFKRAAEKFGAEELSDEQIVEGLKKFGTKIVQVPNFVAKHPFRITITSELSNRAYEFFRKELEGRK